MVLTRGLNGLRVPRDLKRLKMAFSVVVNAGARVVGVVNGNSVLRDPNPARVISSLDVVKGVSVLRPRLKGTNGFLLGNKRLMRFKPLNRLPARPCCFLSISTKDSHFQKIKEFLKSAVCLPSGVGLTVIPSSVLSVVSIPSLSNSGSSTSTVGKNSVVT